MKLKRKILIFLICFLAILCAIGAAILFNLLYDPDKSAMEVPTKYAQVSATATDKDGNVYAAVVDANGVTYAAMQDTNGDLWQVAFNPDGSLGKPISCLNGLPGMDAIFTTVPGATNPNTTKPIVQSNNQSDYEGEAENDTTPTKKHSKNDGNKKPNKTNGETELNVVKFKRLIQNSNYYIEFTTNDPTLGTEPIVSAVKDGNIAFNTTIEDMNCKVIYRVDKDKAYAVIDDWNVYAALPNSMFKKENVSLGDLNILASYFSREFDNENTMQSQAEINGKKVTRETCVTSKGTRYDYYFDKGNFVRIDITTADGELTTMYINKISTDVPDEIFVIPQGYRYLNLSWM